MNITKTLQILICFAIIATSCKQVKNNPRNTNENLVQNANTKWVAPMIQAYKEFNKNRSVKAANYIFEATELMPNKNLENYLVSAMVYAQNKEKEKALKAIERAIEEGFKDSELLNSIPEYISLKNNPRWNKLILETDNRRSEYEKSIQNIKLLELLRNLWAKDQEALNHYEDSIKNIDSTATAEDYRRLFEPVENRWEINKNKLDSIINIYGWPGNKLVGEEGAKVAWSIPQHHPDILFKEKCLHLIKNALEKGDVDPNHYAQLSDRIARETWQKQTYGTSMDRNAPFPIKNPTNVNKERSQIGLIEPMEVHSIYHGIEYKSPSKEEIKSVFKRAQENYKKFENFITLKESDSANTYITKAISAHGDISNQQLFNASLLLAKINDKRSQRMSIKILKVLIWRKWDNRFKILNQAEFDLLRTKPEWIKILKMIELSK